MPNLIGASVGVASKNNTLDVQKMAYLLNILAYGPMPVIAEGGTCGADMIARIKFVQGTLAGMQHPDGQVSPNGPTLRLVGREASMQYAAKKAGNKLPALPGEPGSAGYQAPQPGPLLPSAPNAAHRAAVVAWLDATWQVVLTNFRDMAAVISYGSGTNAEPSTEAYAAAAKSIGDGVEAAMVRAFATVESGPLGAFSLPGRPVIAYEGHWFRNFTNSDYDQNFPLLSYKYKKKAGPEWQTNNKDQDTAWTTLTSAARLDAKAAAKSCSWGRYQIMGFNHAACGHKDVLDFVTAMKAGETEQLNAFVSFCKSLKGFSKAMKDKDYKAMATAYNGTDYGDYDKRIERAYKAFTAKP